MGEARTRTQIILGRDPECIFCGSPSTNRDHCPPITVFDGGHRPLGLEFGSCDACRQGTRHMDLVAGMISRLMPTPATEEGRAEVRKHIRGVINNHRELALLFADQLRRGEEIDYGGVSATPVRVRDNPKLNRCLNAFAARIGFALHRELTGRRVPDGSGLVARWMSNVELDSNEALDGFLREVGNPWTLAAGRWHTTEQFRYWGAAPSDDPEAFACFAGFRRSFGIFAATLRVAPEMPPVTLQFVPGFLRRFEF